eukprot:SAG31_NODE_580_length_13940_cov_16.175349_5_plen_111_part_00
MLESYYVNKLCSPTRTALLSGRYAYTIGQDDGVIVDGTPNDLQLNLLTIADRLQQGGINISYYLILSHTISYYLILSHTISYYVRLEHECLWEVGCRHDRVGLDPNLPRF